MGILRRNMLYGAVLAGAQYVFPLVVFPYVSRVLGTVGIGTVGFVDATVGWFIMFSMMGVTAVGIREVARSRHDAVRLARTFGALESLHALFTLIAAVALVAAVFAVPELRGEWKLMGIGLGKLVFNLFIVDWLFKGLEDFRYIALRTVAIRFCYIVGVFIFVSNRSDVEVYYFLTALTVVATACVNVIESRRVIGPWRWTWSFGRYVPMYLRWGFVALAGAGCTLFPTVFLGFAASKADVGYFVAVMKLMTAVGLVTEWIGAVMTPRLSVLEERGETEAFRRLFRKNMAVFALLSVAAGVCASLWAPLLMGLFAGAGFAGAVPVLRICACFLPAAVLTQVFLEQSLLPKRRDVQAVTVLGAGFLTAVAANMLLVPVFRAEGSAWAWGCAQTVCLVTAVFLTQKQRPLISSKV